MPVAAVLYPSALCYCTSGAQQRQKIETITLIFCGGKQESALLESCLHTVKVPMQIVPLAWQGVKMCANYTLVCFRLLSSSLQSVTPPMQRGLSIGRAPGASQLSRDSRVSSGRGRRGALDK